MIIRYATHDTLSRSRLQRQPSLPRVSDTLLRAVQHKQQSAALRSLCDSFAASRVGVALRLRVHERNCSVRSCSTEWIVISPASHFLPFAAIHLIIRLETSSPLATISDAIGCKRSGRSDGVRQCTSVVVCSGQGEGISNTTVSGVAVLIR